MDARRLSLADDGEHLIIKDDNFIETKDPGRVVLTFIEHGRVVREVTLGEILPDLSKMWRSASSWNLGVSLPGLNDHGEFAVTTVDYRILHFDVKTGQLLRSEWNYLEQLRDLLGIRARLRTPIVLFFLGAIIGVVCRGRIFVALVVTLVVCAALLLFVLWAEGTFINRNTLDAHEREFTTGARSFIQSMSILYLVPSTFLVLVTSFLLRRIRKRRSQRGDETEVAHEH
jgi:hypothetical protein